MTIVVSALIAVVGLLGVLVVGLLRSHAQILADLASVQDRLTRASERGWRPPEERLTTELLPSGLPDGLEAIRLRQVRGENLEQVPVVKQLSAYRPTLLAFLSTGCLTCASFFEEFGLRESDVDGLPFDLLVVTKSREEENLTRLREVAPANVCVVMSSETWADFEVPGSPFFVLIDHENGDVAGAGSANVWSQVESLVQDALGERAYAAGVRGDHNGTASFVQRTHDDLATVGIGPDHPSLYLGVYGEDLEPNGPG